MNIYGRNRGFENVAIPLLTMSAFGPLLIPSLGIRADHIVLYGMLLIAFGFLCIGRRSMLSGASVIWVLSLFVFITIWTQVVTIGGVPAGVVYSNRTQMDEFSALENYLEIIIIIFVSAEMLRAVDYESLEKLFSRVAFIIIAFMGLNALLSVGSIFFDTSAITSLFVRDAGGAANQIIEITAEGGRKSGIFGFPATAGVAYSLALLLWTYTVRCQKRISFHSLLVGFLLIIGGTITISKTFMLGGLPLFFIYWLLPGRKNPRLTGSILFLLASGCALIYVLIENWVGASIIADLFTDDANYSIASRFFHFVQIRYGISDDLEVTGIFPYLWEVSPVQGLGFAYWRVIDSAYLQYFMQGGAVSLFLYLLFIATLAILGAIEWRNGNENGKLLTLFSVLLLLAGIGAPVLTSSRVNILFIVIIVILRL